MNQQERTSLLQSIGKFIKAQFAGYERRLELAEQKAAQALALDIDARIKLATLEAVTAATQKMQADLEGARAAADEAARKALEVAGSMRQPEDGKSVTVEDVAPLLERAVADAVAKIPEPKDGKSVTLDDVRPVIDEALKLLRSDAESVFAETLEQAQVLRDSLAKSLGELRQPEDGESISLDDVRPIIEEVVKREVDAIPRPEDGKSVTIDDVRPLVDEAVKSAVAAIEVPEPRDGEDGRDALQLEILPIIDPDKSYPRGSYAKHLGGLWRAYEQTHGMRGWECIVEGIATLSVEQIDERTFVIDCGLSSGRAVRKEVAVPMVIDRGVYRADGEYRAGDGVTWAGSYWIAKDDTPQGKPGEPGSDGWRLAVKRGRDGKDGRNGIDKTAPVRVEK